MFPPLAPGQGTPPWSVLMTACPAAGQPLRGQRDRRSKAKALPGPPGGRCRCRWQPGCRRLTDAARLQELLGSGGSAGNHKRWEGGTEACPAGCIPGDGWELLTQSARHMSERCRDTWPTFVYSRHGDSSHGPSEVRLLPTRRPSLPPPRGGHSACPGLWLRPLDPRRDSNWAKGTRNAKGSAFYRTPGPRPSSPARSPRPGTSEEPGAERPKETWLRKARPSWVGPRDRQGRRGTLRKSEETSGVPLVTRDAVKDVLTDAGLIPFRIPGAASGRATCQPPAQFRSRSSARGRRSGGTLSLSVR